LGGQGNWGLVEVKVRTTQLLKNEEGITIGKKKLGGKSPHLVGKAGWSSIKTFPTASIKDQNEGEVKRSKFQSLRLGGQLKRKGTGWVLCQRWGKKN